MVPIGPATSASRPEKTTSHSAKGPVGSHTRTMILCTASGISSASFQLTALGYSFPAERGLAPNAWMVKQGCELPMSMINRWPTGREVNGHVGLEWIPVPVAPRMPHFFLDMAAGDILLLVAFDFDGNVFGCGEG
jgi:hypothetical protein